jgi:uncharacterized membrane protein
LKIKFLNDLLTIDILIAVLIIIVSFVPIAPVRVILGLPFILFFPGYVLLAAIFTSRAKFAGIERLALSIVVSIAIVALTGLGLNFTPWGITLESTLYTLSALIVAISLAAFIRRHLSASNKLLTEINFRLPNWSETGLNRYLSITLGTLILIGLGVLGYMWAVPQTEEKFTEFYMLGFAGQAQNYPTEFIMENDRIVRVVYGDNTYISNGDSGNITLGIINNERRTVSYSLAMEINNSPIDVEYDGKSLSKIDNIDLASGEKWENSVGFSPSSIGDNQNLEILLYQANNPSFVETLNLWIDVKSSG